MGIRSFKSIPRTLIEWGRFFNETIVVPSTDSVGTSELRDGQVTFAKIQNVTPDRLLGRDSSPAGVVQELTVGGGLEFTGSGIRRSALTGDVTVDAGSDVTVLRALVDADIPSTIARDTEVTAAITTHEAAVDPHPGYTTAAELSTAISNHSAAADPHSVYPLAAGTETISGAWTFSGEVVLNGQNPSARISSAVPLIMFDENAAAANNRKWRAYAYTEQFVIDAVNDAENSVTHALEIDRTGTTIDAVTLLATLIRLAGAVRMDVSTTTSAPSAGAAGALPATPAGYMTINVNGTNRQVPYY